MGICNSISKCKSSIRINKDKNTRSILKNKKNLSVIMSYSLEDEHQQKQQEHLKSTRSRDYLSKEIFNEEKINMSFSDENPNSKPFDSQSPYIANNNKISDREEMINNLKSEKLEKRLDTVSEENSDCNMSSPFLFRTVNISYRNKRNREYQPEVPEDPSINKLKIFPGPIKKDSNNSKNFPINGEENIQFSDFESEEEEIMEIYKPIRIKLPN